MGLYGDNLESVGRTPLVRLNRCTDGAPGHVYAKLESRNPAGSVKCRIAVSMIEDAEKRGLLKKGIEIVEPTSGNTGVGLAFAAAARGIPLTIVMPENMSLERRNLISFLGAKLVLTPADQGMAGSVRRAEDIVTADPHRYFMPQQFKNPANPAMHEHTTGPEIWNDLNGQVDIFVAGVGTGGTITGCARYFRKTGRNVQIVAVEPSDSPVIREAMKDNKIAPLPHGIQGIGPGFVPEIMDLSLIDRVETVTIYETMDYTRRLAREEGILSGLSSGAAVCVAAKLAQEPGNAGKNIAVIVPDSAERYLSTGLFSL